MMRRPGPLLIVVRAGEALKVYAPFMLLQVPFAQRLPDWAQLPWLVFVWLYSLSRIPVIFFDWFTVGFNVDADAVSHRSGWPSRTTSLVRWSEVHAIAVEQDALHRLLGRNRVTFTLGAQSRPDIVLEAVDPADARLWQEYFEAAKARPAPVQPTPPAQPTPERGPASRLVSRVTPWDLGLISATYGTWLLVVPFAISTYREAADWFQLPTEESILRSLAGSPWLTLLAALIAGLAYGWIRAWLRYGGHTVERLGDAFTISRSAVDRSVRRVQFSEVAGVRIDQNPVMRLARVGTLRLVLAGVHGGEESPTILPAAPMSVVRRQVEELLGAPPPPTRRRYGLALAAAAPFAALAAGLTFQGLYWPAGLTALVALWAFGRLSGSLEVGAGEQVAYARGLLSARSYLLQKGCLRSVSSRRIRSSSALLAVTILDRAPVVLIASGVSDADRRALLSPSYCSTRPHS